MRRIVTVLVALLGSALIVLIVVPEGLTVYGDIVFERKTEVSDTPVAVFPHWVHRIRYRCNVCHPAIFELKRGADPVSMEAMGNGRFCAVCHNGKIAWGISFDTCNRCHVAQTADGH